MSRPCSSAAGFLLRVALFIALAAVPAFAQAPPAAGVIKTIAGGAFIVRGGQEQPATPGQAILEGDTLRTVADGRLGVTLKDGTRLSLGGDTELRLSAFAYAPAQGRVSLVVKLLRGATEYISGRIAQLAPEAVRIETPTSTIGPRGTHLLIGVDQP